MNEHNLRKNNLKQQYPSSTSRTSRREVPNHKSKSDGRQSQVPSVERVPVSSPAVPITAIVTSAPLPGTPRYPVRLPLPQQVATQVSIINRNSTAIDRTSLHVIVTQSTSALPLLVEHPSTQAQVVQLSYEQAIERCQHDLQLCSAGQHTELQAYPFNQWKIDLQLQNL